MPEIDEVVLHDLMHRATADLHAPSAVTSGIVSLHRRRRVRTRVLGLGATGAAAGIVAGALVSGTGSPGARNAVHNGAGSSGTIRLTAAQHTLYHLSDAAAATARPSGRYVVMHEKQTTQGNNGGEESSERIDVINTLTGGGLTYQDYQGAPHQLSDASGTTQAQYDAMPTGTAALRAFLLNQAKQQNAQAEKIMKQKFKEAAKQDGKAPRAFVAQGPAIDDNTLVYEQATYTLWSPLLSPALRSALYRVLAATPGVVVKAGTQDSMGRPAVEISRYNSFAHEYTEVFDNPATGATLETADVTPADPAQHITASYGSDVYQSITRTSTIPPNPYR